MKQCIVWMLCLCTLFPSSLLYAANGTNTQQQIQPFEEVFPLVFDNNETNGGTVFYVKGNVSAKMQTETDWKKVTSAIRITMGEYLKTGAQSSAEIIFDDGTVVHLFENTTIMLQEMTWDISNNITHIVVNVVSGNILVDTPRLASEKSSFDVNTDVAVITLKGGTSLIEAGTKQKTNVAMFEGNATVSNKGKTTALHTTALQKLLETMVYNTIAPIPPAKLRGKLTREYQDSVNEMQQRIKKNAVRKKVKQNMEIRGTLTTETVKKTTTIPTVTSPEIPENPFETHRDRRRR